MGISGHRGHPMEELTPPYKGLVLKGHQEAASGTVGGPGTHGCQRQGDAMAAHGCRDARGTPKIKPHKASGWESRSAEKLQTVSIPVSPVPAAATTAGPWLITPLSVCMFFCLNHYKCK